MDVAFALFSAAIAYRSDHSAMARDLQATVAEASAKASMKAAIVPCQRLLHDVDVVSALHSAATPPASRLRCHRLLPQIHRL